MSKVLGIIAEYNPFHNGHLYHLIKAKQLTKSDFTVAVISGNFTQRGEPSLIDKWSKAESGILGGVDLVIELPVLYSISSAENFAEGAIKLLDSFKVVDDIAFGAETADITILNKFAEVLYTEPKEYKTLLSHELGKGLSYPKARQNALMIYLNDIRKFVNVLSHPNNILGIEYLKALKKCKSNINPVVIKRTNTGYNDLKFSGNIASATAIRDLVANNNIKKLNTVMPIGSYSILTENITRGHVVKNLSNFDKEIIYNLRRMSTDEIRNLPDVSEGLENAIKKAANSCNTVTEFINIVTSKRYTQTRIKRILLYSLLQISKKDIALSKKITPYARVLGFNEKGKYLLSEILRVNPKVPFITSVKKFVDTTSNKNLLAMLQNDIWATNVYTLAYDRDSWSNLDYTKKIVSI